MSDFLDDLRRAVAEVRAASTASTLAATY
jgi:hypothetical protein